MRGANAGTGWIGNKGALLEGFLGALRGQSRGGEGGGTG